MNSNYVAGRRLEYEVMQDWKDKGYLVIRAAASHGLYDLVAFRIDRKPEFIQCKRCKTQAEANNLIKKFKEITLPSRYYHQSMLVKIKGSTGFISHTV